MECNYCDVICGVSSTCSFGCLTIEVYGKLCCVEFPGSFEWLCGSGVDLHDRHGGVSILSIFRLGKFNIEHKLRI